MFDGLNILVCIAFHFDESRLVFLKKVVAGLQKFPCEIKVCVVTNTTDNSEQSRLFAALNENNRFLNEIYPVSNMGHPFMLPWAHKQVLRQHYEESESFTHFLYIEDDIEFTPINMMYWLENRLILGGTVFYPSLFRVEWNEKQHQWFSTDILQPVSLSQSPFLNIHGIDYINMPSSYQGLTLYDRALFAEHLNSPSFNMEKYAGLERLQGIILGGSGYWNGRESANHGQTYMNVPVGFYSRNLLPLSRKFCEIDFRAWVHHLPDNYTNNTVSEFGKVPVNNLFCE
jgi:hypothetical protein